MITVYVDGQRIYMRFTPTPWTLERVKRVPGRRFNPDSKVWTAPATAGVAAAIVREFGADMIDGDDGFAALLGAAQRGEQAQAFKGADGLAQPPIRKTDAWRHQLQAYHFASAVPAAMLDMHMGTGKSRCAVDLIINRGVKRVLICAPASVISGESVLREGGSLGSMAVWPREFYKHAGHDKWDCWNETKGTCEQRAKSMTAFLERCRIRKRLAIVLVNYEAVWRPAFAAAVFDAEFDMVVCDEIHKIKSPAGVASRFFAKLGDTVPYRLGLTGTMTPHSPMDVYGEFRFLDKGIFGTSFTLFRARYALMGGYGGHEIKGYQNQDELKKRVEGITYHAGREVIELPEAIHDYRVVELDAKTRRAYDQMERTFIADVQAGRIVASNALSKLLRLQQITSGYLPVDDGGRAEVIGTDKRSALVDALEEIGKGEPVVVFARFRHDLDQIAQAAQIAGVGYAELSGRANDLRSWQDGGAEVIGVQIQAGGVGIDLTRARHCIYYSVGYSLGDYEQSLARVHRPGQARTVIYTHLLARDTIDQRVYDALQKRREVIDEIFYNLK